MLYKKCYSPFYYTLKEKELHHECYKTILIVTKNYTKETLVRRNKTMTR